MNTLNMIWREAASRGHVTVTRQVLDDALNEAREAGKMDASREMGSDSMFLLAQISDQRKKIERLEQELERLKQ